jgi:hypothetical protein
MNVEEGTELNMSIEYADDDDEVEVAIVASASKYWPHMKVLFTKHQAVAFQILKAVDECKCTAEVNANNGNNPKGNKWNRLYDHCYAGGSPGRGLLAPHKEAFPTIVSVTKLKKKVTEMWNFLKKESIKPKNNVAKELVLMGIRQAKEYDDTCAKEKAAMDKQKYVNEKLQKDMNAFEWGTGALPPGVMGIEGGGRQQHSTNVHTLQPAAYAYVNATTNNVDNDNDNDSVIDLVAPKVVTPKTTASKKQKAKTKTNSGPAVVWEKITNNLSNQIEFLAKGPRGNVNVGSNKSKLDILKEQLKDMQDTISFCKDIPDLYDEYIDAMEGYKATLKEIKEEQKKALEATAAAATED